MSDEAPSVHRESTPELAEARRLLRHRRLSAGDVLLSEKTIQIGFSAVGRDVGDYVVYERVPKDAGCACVTGVSTFLAETAEERGCVLDAFRHGDAIPAYTTALGYDSVCVGEVGAYVRPVAPAARRFTLLAGFNPLPPSKAG